MVVVADSQSAGRGRRNRQWISSPLDSLTFSLLWRFPGHSNAPEALSLVVGLALQRALQALGATTTVKWPNDILCASRKLAGVLIETQPGDIKSAVIGIGLNLRLPPDMPDEIARNAIALDEALPAASATPAKEVVTATLLSHLSAMLSHYETQGFASLRHEWQMRHAFDGREVVVTGGSGDVAGICEGVSDTGELLVRSGGVVRRVLSGDVSLRLA